MAKKLTTKIDFQVLATTLMGAIEKSFIAMCSKRPDAPPKIKKMNIIEWRKKMKIYPFEKFDEFSYVSVVKYYSDRSSQNLDQPFGVVILYIELPYAYSLLDLLKIEVNSAPHIFEGVLTEEDKALADCCGEICNIIAGSLKTELCAVGYPELIMSTPENYVHDVPDGVSYPISEHVKYELKFAIEERVIFVDVVMPLS